MNVKPAVGFTLPSAGVTPAPSEKREMLRTTFRSQVPWEGQRRVQLPRPLFYGRGGRRAQPPVGEGSGFNLHAREITHEEPDKW